ncbi:MAG: lysophospholipid acyltransferase family protein [Rhodoferax sp.]|uniref:lysophospholipid acyltransferase family protein n=1 Tax=Rhodoferax sp. TaxID=50421 RepID=UPI0017FB2C12|nr:lysophospholipid acyltransferase family protein [Rhodoferax sp.]NMM12311.1 lysophospholipid acyltransferase family protein [Rhodoferax sp.]NMM20270.1 lysophospholipid acyltransferase family protein [Rhodoferax sp.]
MITLFKILSVLPLSLVHGLGWSLGWLVFLASGVYRQRFLANARQAGMGWRQWLGAVGESGKLVAELPRLWLGRPVPVLWEGAQHVEDALAVGRGVVFLTPHLGCFEITAQAYAQRYGQEKQPMTVLFRPPRQSWLRELVTSARARPGLHTAPTTLAGVKQMIKALKQGQCLGLLPDQVPPLGMGLWVPFFGREAYTMTLSVRLAQQTGATVLMAWGERLSWGRGYRVHVQPLNTVLPADSAQAARVINQAMETLIRSCPQQYLWGYARYKQPRQEV